MGPCLPEERNSPSNATSNLLSPSLDDNNDDGQQVVPTQLQVPNTVGPNPNPDENGIPVELIDTQQEQQDAWATNEGYTPLVDLVDSSTVGDGGTAHHYVMVSMGPSSNTDNDDASSSYDDDDDAASNQQSTTHLLLGNSSTLDIAASEFQDLATRALSALDEEYRQCHDTASISDGDGQNISAIDEDTKIIVAALDRRKEEIKEFKDQGGFMANWGNVASSTSTVATKIETTSSKDFESSTKTINTDAVRRAVQSLSIKIKDVPFQQKFEEWQKTRKQEWEQKQDDMPRHALIPFSSQKAFYRSTPNARRASAKLTRSATLAEAVARLLLSPPDDDLPGSMLRIHNGKGKNQNGGTLLIDIVGADDVECSSTERIQATFRPFVKWVQSKRRNDLQYEKLHIRLIGRELMLHTELQDQKINLLVHSPDGHTFDPVVLKEAVATCHSGVYHEVLAGLAKSNTWDRAALVSPDLLVAFNAGIWGYQEWKKSIQFLAHKHHAGQSNLCRPIPFVVTAYTQSECEEDYCAIEQAIEPSRKQDGDTQDPVGSYSARIIWKPEANLFGSKVTRDTKSSIDVYRENSFWQAWLLGL